MRLKCYEYADNKMSVFLRAYEWITVWITILNFKQSLDMWMSLFAQQVISPNVIQYLDVFFIFTKALFFIEDYETSMHKNKYTEWKLTFIIKTWFYTKLYYWLLSYGVWLGRLWEGHWFYIFSTNSICHLVDHTIALNGSLIFSLS